MRTYLPTVRPTFDMRFGKRRAEFGGNGLNQRFPVIPLRFVTRFNGRNFLRAEFFHLRKLKERNIKNFAGFGVERNHDFP